jgi:hypothetical protein
VLDDYYDYGGCRQAVDEFLAGRPEFGMALRGANVALRRTAPDRIAARGATLSV